MLIIDRYVLRMFVRVLVVCFVSLTGLFIVIDVFANLDEFLSLAERQGNPPAVLCAYYGPRALAFFDRTSALMAVVAATFTVTSLQRGNELAALMAAGIPKIRIVRPLIGGVIVVSLLAAASRECLIPHYRDQLIRNFRDWQATSERQLHPRYDNRTEILIGGRSSVAAEKRIRQPSFRLPRGLGRFGSQLAAQDAWYRPPTGDRPGGYLLTGMEQPANLAAMPSFYAGKIPVLLTAADTAWLKRDQCFVVSEVTFEQLLEGNAWRHFSSTSELVAALHNPSLDFGADVRVTVHARFVQPLLDVTLFFLGLPLVIARQSRNIFVAAGLCLLVVTAFFLVVLTCHALGSNYLLNPSLAAWIPLLIFVPTARWVATSLWN